MDSEKHKRGVIARVTPSLVAVLAAATTTLVFDLGISLARGWRPGLEYTLAVAGLSLGAALLVGGVLGLSGRPALALAAWVAVHAKAGLLVFLTRSAPWVVLIALVTYGCLVVIHKARGRALLSGVAVAAALALAGQMLGRLLPALGVNSCVRNPARFSGRPSGFLVGFTLNPRMGSQANALLN